MAKIWRKFKNVFSDEEEEDSWVDQFGEHCPKLPLRTRIICWGVCFGIGTFLSFLGGIFVLKITKQPEIFATLYTSGNLVAMAGTCFLWGPCAQCKKMWDSERWLATTIYLVSMVITLVCAFVVPPPWNVLAVIGALIFQFCALVWYSASFIPCGRKILKKIISGVFSCCTGS
mmetsp:Transcript_556/g.812  ORF Transcript_556/g.812 Transcript_556/m.812 type:complete len:173 (-) Transcript_556:220-738(-)|eukprot:CAMPEP_0185259426 /NCGR_PEP_ID=MMETSP1359-20130426/8202_1 /TAXON_ID=552665 /ORGANISM="Bigelowiella longifila, Strain CCMP242" /LENGTH=172 /DNA_ID=CAMNT_0027845325 /DNA_START=40 /DNA_END=558 /DNA_ORIENTATION=-